MSNTARRDFLVATGAAVAGALTWRPAGALEAKATRTWTLPPKRPFEVIENAWIPLKDGTRLGVRLWIPKGAEQSPVPVVWEYLPYRKRDGVRARDDATALHLAPSRASTSGAQAIRTES
jgi:predicted acyl esterase